MKLFNNSNLPLQFPQLTVKLLKIETLKFILLLRNLKSTNNPKEESFILQVTLTEENGFLKIILNLKGNPSNQVS